MTEMVSSKALLYNDEKTKKLLNTKGEKHPISMQIFGSDEESMVYGAKYVSNLADIVDINMGCPAPKVTKNGDGSSLLKDLKKAQKIIEAVVKNSNKPVTLKIRLGWDKENLVARDLAKIAENSGVAAITVHGRTKSDYYSGKANLEEIKNVKEAVSIPVIGNGDIVDEKTALNMFEKTGVDGIMIGRGAIGNPWIFERIRVFLETEDGKTFRHVYIREGDSFRMNNIPGGKYLLKIYQGRNWNSGKIQGENYPVGGFMDILSISVSSKMYILDFPYSISNKYMTYDVTLYKVEGGNFVTNPIDEEDLFGEPL